MYQLFSAPSVKPVIKASLTTVNGLLLVGALLGNILVIHIVRSNLHMRTTTNILIVNMAVSDLLIALIFIPSQVRFHRRIHKTTMHAHCNVEVRKFKKMFLRACVPPGQHRKTKGADQKKRKKARLEIQQHSII